MKALLKPIAIAFLVMVVSAAAFLGLVVVHGSGAEPWSIRLSNNPILKDAQGDAYDMGGPWWYADPEIHRFDGKFWVYATRSAPYERQLNLDCFGSDNLVSWTKHEAIIDEDSLPDSWRCFWAPTVARKDGYYYLLVGTNDLNLGSAANEFSVGDVSGMYLLRSKSPKGPFVQFMGKNVPLIQDNYFGAQAIDANLFLDDDNTMYLVYGGWTTCLMAKFRDDMTGFVPLGKENWKKHNDPDRDAHELNHFMDYFVHLTNFGGRGATNNLKLGELNYDMGFLGTNEYLEEGPIIYKFDGYYYLMYSVGGWTGDTYGLRYAIAKSPMGPYTTIPGRFLQTRYSVGARGTGHHSMVYVEENGTWLNTYHRRPIGGGRDDRYMAMDVAHLYDGEIKFVAYDPLRPAGERVFIEPAPTKVKLFEPTIPTIFWSSDSPLPKNLAGYAQNEHKIGTRPRYSASGQRAATTQAAHAFDAGINTRSYWEADGAKPGHWLCVDFGEATTYNEI
ncbi:MAG: family 43 glycosylhydrolase, partial [Holophagales bacterium]|nr:family 43 glycosylhydrolase [Holophagales bacterium]